MPRNLVKIIPTKNTFDIYKTPEISCFTKLSIYPLTTPSGPPTMTNLPCYDNCTLFITLYIPDKNTIDYLLLLFVSPICKLPAKIQLVNGKHEVLQTLFFWPGSTTRIRKTLVREEVRRSALETTDPKSRRPTRKKLKNFKRESFCLYRLLHRNSRLQKHGNCSVSDSVLEILWKKKLVCSTGLSLQLFYPSYKA